MINVKSSKDFCFWLGSIIEHKELSGELGFSEIEINLIKEKITNVFISEIDPSFGDKEQQLKLNKIHEGIDYDLYDPNHNFNKNLFRC